MAKGNKENITTDQVKRIPNPTGKGGFGDHPENRNPGGWKKTETFRYWFEIFKEMTVTELKKWQRENPENTRKVVADLAFTRIVNAKGNLKEFREVADRTEGKATQKLEHSGIIERELVISDEVKDAIKKAFRENIRKKSVANSGTNVSGRPVNVGDSKV